MDSRLIFIGGAHRSGTSLIHRILSSHPSFSGFAGTGVFEDEGQHLQDVYPPARAFGGPGGFAFNRGAFMDERHSLATLESRDRLIEQWTPFWDTQKPYLLEKSPPNIIRTRFLQALFPMASFVIVLRHPIAVAYATKKWNKAAIPRLVEHTVVCYERFAADSPHLSQAYVLRYEDLAANPADSIAALLAWIGAEPGKLNAEVKQGLNEQYFARWRADRRSPLKQLSAKLRGVDLSLSQFEERVNAFGYSVAEPEELLHVPQLARRARTTA